MFLFWSELTTLPNPTEVENVKHLKGTILFGQGHSYGEEVPITPCPQIHNSEEYSNVREDSAICMQHCLTNSTAPK